MPVAPRPRSVTAIAWLFIAEGTVGLCYHATEIHLRNPLENGAIWVCLVRLMAIVFGAFVLRGSNLARWLLLAWIAYHVVLSGFHSVFQLVVHGLLLGVITWLLVRPAASAFFRGGSRPGPPPGGPEAVPDTGS